MPRSPVRVRLALVGIFAVFALGFLVPPSQAQPGRPPGFPSAPARPPGMPARPPGAGVTGISGAGIHGIHGTGIHGIHGTGIHGIHGAGITGIPNPPGFGSSRNEWVCSGCRHVVGTGPIRPSVTTCPGCGARFSNPGAGAPGGAAGTVPPGAGSEPSLLAPELPPNPAAGGTTTPPTESAAVAAPFSPDATAAPDEPEPKRGSRTILIVAVVGGGLFLIGAMAMLAFVVMKANAPTKPRRRPTRRALDLDD